MDFKWQMRVANSPSSFAVDVYIFRNVAEGKREYISNLSGPAGMVATTIDEGGRMEPAMRIDRGSTEILQALADGLHDFGVKPRQEPILKNELTATKYHLSDMRDMVCIVAGVKKGQDFGKDTNHPADGNGVACRHGKEAP